MPGQTKMYWLHAVTPLHVGTGFGLGFIDLPVMREKITDWPIVPGSAVKGVLADYHKAATDDQRKANPQLKAAFGMSDDDDPNNTNSGSLVFTDARLACLAVRSLYGTFAWVTSALALERLKRDLDTAGLGAGLEAHCAVTDKRAHVLGSVLKDAAGKTYLADLDFTAHECPVAKAWSEKFAQWIFPDSPVWQQAFTARFAILPDDSFDFLCETGTEVNARVRIDPERKSVDKGALWYEEYLPAESILAGLVWCDHVFPKSGEITPTDLMKDYCSKSVSLQIGGKATVGKGRVRCVFGANHA